MVAQSVHIEEQLFQQRKQIENWFEAQWSALTPSFYMSVDLRHSGLKLAPVDVNLYPAGFNNLSTRDVIDAAGQAKQLLNQIQSNCQRILVVTENHTRNLYYLDNVAALKNLLVQAGFSVKLSQLPSSAQTVQTQSGETLVFEKVEKDNDYLRIDDFTPDCIVLNNDLSDGLSPLLMHIKQPIVPSPKLGWYNREKSQYFVHYHEVCQRFAEDFTIDDWLLSPLFSVGKQLDFKNVAEQTALVENASSLFDAMIDKHREYGFIDSPYLVIKANSGSYGMGVMTANNADDLRNLSRKQRQRMSVTKGNRPVQDVLIQEGIPTITNVDGLVAEPVIYLIGSKVIGGFYRMHTTRNAQENLNTPGMQFKPMTLHQSGHQSVELLYAYQVVARLAALAAALEIKVAS